MWTFYVRSLPEKEEKKKDFILDGIVKRENSRPITG